MDETFNVDSSFHRFLRKLGGPTVFHIKGRDNSRTRVVLTLLHGNEPSGLKALHGLLKAGFVPETDCKFVVASVVAARTEPTFCHRMLPGQRDLNRCFAGPFNDPQGKLAEAIIEQLHQWQPESIIDVHNTSGSGPAFSVSVCMSSQAIALASHFTHRIIHTDIRLGSIMEQDFGCPIVTIEAGGAEDQEADENAMLGLRSYLTQKNVFVPQRQMELLDHPRRLEIKSEVTIDYAESLSQGSNVTIRQDVEKHNFGITLPEQQLGWLDTGGLEHFVLDNPAFSVADYFECKEGQLYVKQPTKLFMVTTRTDIAKSDCLFYFVA